MAYAVLCSLTQTIGQILSHDEHYHISVDGKQQIKSLQKEVDLLQDFLKKFPKQAMSLETRIRNAANHAEDVLEHFMYEETRSTTAISDVEHGYRELEMAMEGINSLAKEAAGIEKESGDRPWLPPSPPRTWPTPAPALDGFTVGLDEDVKKIRGLVCDESPERRIIPITGMGGIGKTTLAWKIYNDPLVKETFPVRAWVTVSQDYLAENIFQDLLYSLESVIEEGLVKTSDVAADKLYKILTVSRYLIVVDDIWSEKAWDDIRRAFGDPSNGNGSRIMITTRITSVASHISPSSSLHEMQFLRPDQSWDLLKQKVLKYDKRPPELQKIGKDIATSCKGLPLAVVLVAGILSIEESRDAWEEVAKDVHSAIDKNGGEFSRVISLSYTHLPLYLRPCFLYMGGFPEDHEIRLSKLIKLWIAEGFVKDEEEAEKYSNNLMTRNLALVSTIKSNGKVKSCIIHDLVRDLCRRKALDENYERRLSISHPDLRCLAKNYASTVRSVICFQPTQSSLLGLRKLRLLRVLDVVDTHAYSLPASVFELFHLRYLALCCSMEIPRAISRLQNLRTLIIRPSERSKIHSMDEVYLPLEIWMMPLLTHLVSFFDLLPNPEGAVSPLENLLTLSVVKKLICTREMTEMIPNVKKLSLTYSVDKYQEDYQLQNLVFLHQLEKLTLVMERGSVVRLEISPRFPTSLRKLTLSGWRFPWEYMKDVGSLPNLQVLKLRDHACEGNTWETEVGQFAKLEFLLIDASDLKRWVTGKYHFRVLKRLVLHGCDKLSEIPDAIGDISTLELIEVDRANKSLVECVQRIQKEQIEEYDNKLLRVRAL